MKHLLLSLLLCALLWPGSSQAQTAPRILLNNQLISVRHLPFTQQTVLYLPIQTVEHLGFQLQLDPVQRSAKIVGPDKFFYLKAGSRFITWQQKGLQLSHAPIWQDQTLFVPRSLFANLNTVLAHSTTRNEVRLSVGLNRLQNVQVFPTDVYTRLVFAFSQQAAYHLKESKDSLTLELKGIDLEDPESIALPPINDLLLKGIKIEKTGTATASIRIDKAYASPHKLFWLKDPHRLVVDLVKIFQEESVSTVAPGVQLSKTYQGFPFGPVTYHTLRIAPSANVRLEPAVANQGRGFKAETVSQLAGRHRALAAINTTYFNNQGMPLGLLMKNQELISSPIYGRSLLAILERGLDITQSTRSLSVQFPIQNRTMAFHAVNLPRQNNQVVLYTPRYGYSTRTQAADQALELQVLLDGTVQQVGTHNLSIPEDGFVISAHGEGAQWLKQQAYEGMRALIFSKLWEQWDSSLQHLISGGPQLLKAGKPHITAEQERFQPDIAQGRAPRTALGLGASGEIVLLVADGRQSHSRGLTLTELARILQEKGAVSALNFDGGGSSAMVVQGRLVNQPSDGRERPVASALLVLAK